MVADYDKGILSRKDGQERLETNIFDLRDYDSNEYLK